MVRHIVFWNLRETAEGCSREENALKIKEKLEGLVSVVPGLLSAQVGLNYNPKGYDLCLLAEFADRQAQADYQVHPAHQAVREFVHKVITDRAVVDYDC